MELVVTNHRPEEQLQHVKKFAKDLVVSFAMHMAQTIASLMRHVLNHDPDSEMLFLPQFWFLPLYRELLNTASRHRPTRESELRRSASGVLKVICRTIPKGAKGKGKGKGKPPKQGSAVAGFLEWFGSTSMMNILYVWFPVSWGPSVAEAIQQLNAAWVTQNPVIRDPQMFSDADVLKGEAARDATSKIQKWNVVAPRFYPILVANARVDWLGLKDDEITKQFHTLLEGILQDVFALRASAAWQGAQAQKLTVSLLLPGEGTAAQWRDFLQSKRRLWPTMSHRYAALAPLQEDVLQRESRHMRAKHLWDYIDIDWYELGRKLKVTEPTGLPRQYLWDLLFVVKHRQNPFQEGMQVQRLGLQGSEKEVGIHRGCLCWLSGAELPGRHQCCRRYQTVQHQQ